MLLLSSSSPSPQATSGVPPWPTYTRHCHRPVQRDSVAAGPSSRNQSYLRLLSEGPRRADLDPMLVMVGCLSDV